MKNTTTPQGHLAINLEAIEKHAATLSARIRLPAASHHIREMVRAEDKTWMICQGARWEQLDLAPCLFECSVSS